MDRNLPYRFLRGQPLKTDCNVEVEKLNALTLNENR